VSISKFKTMRHIETVRNYLNCAIHELLNRQEQHDKKIDHIAPNGNFVMREVWNLVNGVEFCLLKLKMKRDYDLYYH